MSNPGLGRETSPAHFPNTYLEGAKLQFCVCMCMCFFFSFESQGKPDRDHVSESSYPIQHQSCGILIASPGSILLCDH